MHISTLNVLLDITKNFLDRIGFHELHLFFFDENAKIFATDNVSNPFYNRRASIDINRTILHHAVAEGRVNVVKHLLSLPEISFETKNRWSRKPIDDAEMNLGSNDREKELREIVGFKNNINGNNNIIGNSNNNINENYNTEEKIYLIGTACSRNTLEMAQ
ncbi:hypothetical protein Glove_350g24 [Diversispora epigaea]|uniref:Uncharacterized protein n=1 Tax=Diversispora epigaea TaxID=1348612 RepID=A0A397HCT6_9GLOM|nr:hypothetical protein Glove_350g24 [Diversispora epigaea]